MMHFLILASLPTNGCKNPTPPAAYIPARCAQLPTPYDSLGKEVNKTKSPN